MKITLSIILLSCTFCLKSFSQKMPSIHLTENDGLAGNSIRDIMCSAAQLDVPLIVDIGVGDNWDEAH